jgi:23S rRNA pseudouridine2605 synthase/23S rRNA pseudouridine2604 synthase
MQERIQKILSARGIASRRKAEEYIERGLVKVNGITAVIGQKADPAVDTIEVDGQVLQERQEMLYYLFHKPVGVITTNVDPSTRQEHKEVHVERGEKTVRELLPKELQGKIYPVGRLDKDTSGLLLFTNDGVLAYRLTHPSFDHEKEYEVESEVPVTDGQLLKLREGVKILGAKTKPAVVRRTGPASFRIAITEGRNRQIRRMCQKVGAPVLHLKRIRILTLTDERLQPGQLRQLTEQERSALRGAVQV